MVNPLSSDASKGLIAHRISFDYASNGSRYEVFRDLSISIPRGEVFGIFGPNGVGKTTLMRALGGMQSTDGEIMHPEAGLAQRSTIGYIPQAYARSFYPWLTLNQNILLSLESPFSDIRKSRARIKDAHDALGLNLDLSKRPAQCSGGMLQQAAIVRAIARRPSILIADEPFSALDFDVSSRVREGFTKVVRMLGICAVLVLHDLQDIVEVCDTVLAIPGRPYTSSSTLKGYYQAKLFSNGNRVGPSQDDSTKVSGSSPFVDAIQRALGSLDS
ncbi:ATP-binding cassette domain-containing protein [Cyanobium sp. FGCU-6]|nr:ATP-binding cassette domain-containing protein [Cyanobium sp. FGCU6]